MKSSKELFDLINSLEKAEKRNFKLYLARYDRDKESNESTLFDILNKMQKLDEEKIKTRFHAKTKHKSIPFVKNKLMNSLLDFLADYHNDKDTINQLSKIYCQARLLRKKRLIELANKSVEKGIALAGKIENSSFLYLFQELKFKLLFHDPRFNETIFEETIENLNQTLNQVNNYNTYYILNKRLVVYHNNLFKLSSKLVKDKIDSLLKAPHWQDESQANSFLSRLTLYDSKALFYYTQQDFPKMFSYFKKVIECYQTNQIYINNEPQTYLSVMFNYITTLHANQKHDDAIKQYDNIALFLSNKKIQWTQLAKLDFQILYYTSYAESLALNLKFDLLNNFLQKERKNIEQVISYHENRRLSYYTISCMNDIIQESYQNVIDWLPKIDKDINLKLNDRIFAAKTMELIAHHELGNIDLLQSRFNSLYYQSRKDEKTPLEESLLKTLRTLSNHSQSSKLQDNLKESLAIIEQMPMDHLLIYFLGIKKWIKNNIV